MTEREQDKDRVTVPPVTPEMPERKLPYRIDLWTPDGTSEERLLARATTLSLARAIFAAAKTDYPARRITLRQGLMTHADTDQEGLHQDGMQPDGEERDKARRE